MNPWAVAAIAVGVVLLWFWRGGLAAVARRPR